MAADATPLTRQDLRDELDRTLAHYAPRLIWLTYAPTSTPSRRA